MKTFKSITEMFLFYMLGIKPGHWKDYSEEPDRTIRYTVSATNELLQELDVSETDFRSTLTALNVELRNNNLDVQYDYTAVDDTSADFVVRWDAHPQFPFDGRGKTLAYTLVCERNRDRTLNTEGSCSDVFFDPAEAWGRQIHTFTVLWHELLHSIGVEHHNNFRGLMYASYTGERLTLHSSDVDAIEQALAV